MHDRRPYTRRVVPSPMEAALTRMSKALALVADQARRGEQDAAKIKARVDRHLAR